MYIKACIIIGEPKKFDQIKDLGNKPGDFPHYSEKLCLDIPKAGPLPPELLRELDSLYQEMEVKKSTEMIFIENIQSICTPEAPVGSFIARVEAIMPEKPYGRGKLIVCTAFDKTGKLQLVFSDRAYEIFQKNVKEGEIYCFRRGKYKKVKERYRFMPSDTEIWFDRGDCIKLHIGICTIPPVCDIHLADIGSLARVQDNSTLCVIGIVQYKFESKCGGMFREIKIYDESKHSVMVKFDERTLRTNESMEASLKDLKLNSIIVIQNLKVKQESPCTTLKCLFSTRLYTSILPMSYPRMIQLKKFRSILTNGLGPTLTFISARSQAEYPIMTVSDIINATRDYEIRPGHKKYHQFECHAYVTDFERFPYSEFCVIENCKKMTYTNTEAVNQCPVHGCFAVGVAPVVIYSIRI